jgi:hypothetical protein
MEIKLKEGIGELKFGMKQKDVEAVLGMPDRQHKDDDKNIIYLYNTAKLRLTFYADEDFRFGYLIVSHPETKLLSGKIIGTLWAETENKLKNNGIKDFEKETFDSLENYFNEANWVIIQAEFGEVIRVELGAIINTKDEFDWKFNA